MTDFSNLKKQVLIQCQNLLSEKRTLLHSELQTLQEALENESKSSAGDKYETARAMAQLEKEKGSMQLAEAIKLKKAMQAFSQSAQSSNIELGSLVKANKSWYYISISAGEVSLDGIPCICISPVSPLGATMIGLSAGDYFTFNKQKVIIVEVH